MQQSLGVLLHEVVALLDRSGGAILQRELGITYAQFYLLSAARRIGPASQQQLAASLGHSDAAVSRMLSVLAASGLVTSESDPGNRRRNIVLLTSAGAALAVQAEKLLERKLADLMRVQGVDEAALLAQASRLRDGLRATGADAPGVAKPGVPA